MRVPFRLFRGTVLGLVVLALSVSAHTVAGGQPPWAAVAAAGVLTVVGCTLLAGRELSGPRLLAIMLLGQLAVHATLMTSMGGDDASPSAAPGPAGDVGSMGAMAMAGSPAVEPQVVDPMASMPGMADGPLGLSPSMVAGHVVAAVIAALALRHGETLLLRLAAFLAVTPSRLASLVPLVVPGLPPQRPVRWEPLGGRTVLLTHSLRRRGPPMVATS